MNLQKHVVEINTVDEMRADISRHSKRGISFILASVVLWAAISAVWLLSL